MRFSDTKCRKDLQKRFFYKDPVSISHQWLREILTEGMVAVDATAGNGYDTEFLASLVGSIGKVYAFDIQEQAINKTKKRLLEKGLADRVDVINSGHENLKSFIKCPINAMIFNLGYLPGSDKSIITRGDTTLAALNSGMDLLLPGGLIVLTVYTGHPGGLDEWLLLREYLKNLPQDSWIVQQLTFLNRHDKTPFNVVIQRIKKD